MINETGTLEKVFYEKASFYEVAFNNRFKNLIKTLRIDSY